MTTQELLTSLCAVLEIGGFAFFTIEFIRFSITHNRTLSVQKSTVAVTSSLTESKLTANPVTQKTEAQLGAVPETTSTNVPVVVDEQQPLINIQQSPQSTKPKSNRKPKQTNKAQSSPNEVRPQKPCEKLRQRCIENGISWKKANSDGKNLTTKQMITALTERNIDINDIVPNQCRNGTPQHKNVA